MKAIMVVLLVLLTGSVAMAQTRISGTVQCRPPFQHTSIPVGDQVYHSMTLVLGRCAWSKPMEVAGAKTKVAVSTASSDANGVTADVRGCITDFLDSGDNYTISVQATVILKNSKPVSQRGTWTFVSGTGKLKVIKGKGTFTGRSDGENMVSNVEGVYELRK